MATNQDVKMVVVDFGCIITKIGQISRRIKEVKKDAECAEYHNWFAFEHSTVEDIKNIEHLLSLMTANGCLTGVDVS